MFVFGQKEQAKCVQACELAKYHRKKSNFLQIYKSHHYKNIYILLMQASSVNMLEIEKKIKKNIDKQLLNAICQFLHYFCLQLNFHLHFEENVTIWAYGPWKENWNIVA